MRPFFISAQQSHQQPSICAHSPLVPYMRHQPYQSPLISAAAVRETLPFSMTTVLTLSELPLPQPASNNESASTAAAILKRIEALRGRGMARTSIDHPSFTTI